MKITKEQYYIAKGIVRAYEAQQDESSEVENNFKLTDLNLNEGLLYVFKKVYYKNKLDQWHYLNIEYTPEMRKAEYNKDLCFSDVISITEKDIRSIRNFGEKRVRIVREFFEKYGFKLEKE